MMLNYSVNFQKEKVNNLRIGNTTFIDTPNNLKLKDQVYIGHHNFIEASHGVSISKGCQITSFVTISSHSSHISIRLYGSNYSSASDHIGYIKGPISIGEFTFIGPHVVIMPNTHIGKGCIVSAYSYVKGDFPEGSIIAGNPAKVVGKVKDLDQKYLDENPGLKTSYLS